MMRWANLFPRIAILLLIICLLIVSIDPLLKRNIVKTTEDITGAKVDIGQVKSSLLKGKVFLKDVAISDPRDPMRNLLQADVAYLQLDPRKLLHRELIIEHGHSKRVIFGSPRTSSGKLENRDNPSYLEEKGELAWLPAKAQDESRSDSKRWLDQIPVMPRPIEARLEVTRVASELINKWPAEIAIQKSALIEAQGRRDFLRRQMDQPIDNPLPGRGIDRAREIRQQLKTVQAEIAVVRKNIRELSAQAQVDRQKLVTAKSLDHAKVSQINHASQATPEQITKLLLGRQQAEYTNDVVNWIRWFQQAVPNPETDFHPAQSRGQDVVFNGQKPKVSFLIKKLDLDGEGTLAGQHFNFAGVAKNLTTQPMHHDQPTSFELRAQGNHHLIVNCILDRRQPVWKDSLQIKGPEINADAQLLGDSESILVEMAPSRVQIDLDIQLTDNQLAGNLQFAHSECAMVVNHINDLIGDEEVALRMNQELHQTRQFKTYATLSGTLDEPVVEFTSDLGTKIANALNKINDDQRAKRIANHARFIDQVFSQKLAQVDAVIQQQFGELTTLLQQEETRVAEMIEQAPTLQRWPEIRR